MATTPISVVYGILAQHSGPQRRPSNISLAAALGVAHVSCAANKLNRQGLILDIFIGESQAQIRCQECRRGLTVVSDMGSVNNFSNRRGTSVYPMV